MSTLVIVMIGIVSLIVLLSPFFAKKGEKKEPDAPEYDRQEKEYVFSQLADLEYDFRMGKLSKSDFDKTKAELTTRAAKFVRPAEKLRERSGLKVDKEIKTHLEKNGLSQSGGAYYEN